MPQSFLFEGSLCTDWISCSTAFGADLFALLHPVDAGHAAQSSAAIVDGFFVGRYVGAMSLAALNLVMPMFSLFFGVGVMLASGGAVRAGKYLGEKRPEAASAIFTKTMLSLLLVGLAASAGCCCSAANWCAFSGRTKS